MEHIEGSRMSILGLTPLILLPLMWLEPWWGLRLYGLELMDLLHDLTTYSG